MYSLAQFSSQIYDDQKYESYESFYGDELFHEDESLINPQNHQPKFINPNTDIICDDFKRVTVKGTNNTYHVDCNGHDLDGTLILIDLAECGLGGYSYSNYDTKLDPSHELRYRLNDTLVTAHTFGDFFHCSHCNECRPYNFSSVWVSIELFFHLYINFEYSATRTKLLIFQCIRC